MSARNPVGWSVVLFIGWLAVAALTAPPAAEGMQSTPTSTTIRPPLRPPDPPLPEPVHIRREVSNLVVTGIGESLRITPLSAIEPAPLPGQGDDDALESVLEFSLPALAPLVLALLLVVVPQPAKRRQSHLRQRRPA